MSEKILTVAEAAQQFNELVDRASHLREGTLIMDNGIAVARLTPVEPAKTTDELLKAWPTIHHLTLEEAAEFETDLQAARAHLPPLIAQWD